MLGDANLEAYLFCARNLLEIGGLSKEKIAECTSLPIEAVNKLYDEIYDLKAWELEAAAVLEFKKDLQERTLFDDGFMSVYFAENNLCAERVINVILEGKTLKVNDTRVQYNIKGLWSRGVVMDVLATGSDGKKYNIEVQRAANGAVPKRARYHSSLLDYSTTVKGEKYEDLIETYVIFITETDILGSKLPIYHIDRTVRETGKRFDDGSHIIYVNGEIKDNTPLGRLMHDFACKDPRQMHYKELAERAVFLKETEEGMKEMTGLIGKWVKEGEQRGEQRGVERERRKLACKLLENHALPLESISELTELPLAEVQGLEKLLSEKAN